MSDAPAQILAAIDAWRAELPGVLVVAIDGHGGAGKTTIASAVSIASGGEVIHTDDYFLEAEDTRDPRPMARYYAWETLREESLGPAIARLGRPPVVRGEPRPGTDPRPETGPGLILVEGVSSGSPALADLVDRVVFVSTPERVRLARLHGRISDEEWDEEWLYAERLYFASRPPESFDLVVPGAD